MFQISDARFQQAVNASIVEKYVVILRTEFLGQVLVLLFIFAKLGAPDHQV